jgi:hypothetical protein
LGVLGRHHYYSHYPSVNQFRLKTDPRDKFVELFFQLKIAAKTVFKLILKPVKHQIII